MDISIRPIKQTDYAVVETITRDAFWDVYRPGCDEHWLVHRIHESGLAAAELDLIAEHDGQIVGNAVCTPACIECANGERITDVLHLGPLTVCPAAQRQGVGRALLAEMAGSAAQRGWRAIFLMGNPAYYQRFGYQPIRKFGLSLPGGIAPDDAMVLPLYPGALDGVRGVYREPALYHTLRPEDVAVFERQYPPREKHTLPTQIFAPVEAADPSSAYRLMAAQLRELAEACPRPLPALANCAALIWASLPLINWAGFYLASSETLYLGPFQGKPACTVIPFDRGVCGAAASTRSIQLVPDVHRFPGHIARDGASRSEIVLPLVVGGALVGVMDIDSPILNRFDARDQAGLSALCQILTEKVNWEGGLV